MMQISKRGQKCTVTKSQGGKKGVFQMWNASKKYTAYTVVP